MDIMDLVEAANDNMRKHIEENAHEVDASELGLDPRCGKLYITDEAIIAKQGHRVRMLDYYGGFEYVEAGARKVVGDYVAYMIDDDRVNRHLEPVAIELGLWV